MRDNHDVWIASTEDMPNRGRKGKNGTYFLSIYFFSTPSSEFLGLSLPSSEKLVSCMIVCFCELDLTDLAHAGVSLGAPCDDLQASFNTSAYRPAGWYMR